MTIYADYTYYTGTYLAGRSAAIAAADFPFFARQASAEIDRYTFGSVPDDIPDEVKLCCCELAEYLHAENTSEAGGREGVASESVQGWTVTMESSAARSQAHRNAVRECVCRYLSRTGLLYSGV